MKSYASLSPTPFSNIHILRMETFTRNKPPLLHHRGDNSTFACCHVTPCSVTCHQVEAPTDGVLVHGLFCDGLRWDDERKEVTDAIKGVMNSPLPMIHMLPQMDYEPDEGNYTSPLYKTSARAGVLSTTGGAVCDLFCCWFLVCLLLLFGGYCCCLLLCVCVCVCV